MEIIYWRFVRVKLLGFDGLILVMKNYCGDFLDLEDTGWTKFMH